MRAPAKRPTATQRHRAAVLSGSVSFVFFGLVWYFAANIPWSAALGVAVLMGLVVLLSYWYLPSRRGS